ncbi:MAG: prolipoprotein diacylglyceryl transferase [Denitrovibrio sp.]|nr:MAG: prolipoprotein diacylglyceryl transferase [Denitrovibrio sp.]
MFPYLFKIGFFELRVYSLMYIIGLLLCIYMVRRKAELLDTKKESVENAVIVTFLMSILGARMYYVLFRWDYYDGNFFEMIAVWHGGLAIHGGIIAGILTILVYCRIKNINPIKLGDSIVPWLLFAQGLGRIGNLANGEAHGVPTITPPSVIFQMKNGFQEFWKTVLNQEGLIDAPQSITKLTSRIPLDVNFKGQVLTLKEYFPWGISFSGKYNTPAFQEFGRLPVHPTFIYEMLLNFIFFIPLYILWRKDRNIGTGKLVGLYLIFYAFIRSFVTFFRADDLMAGPFRAPHLISIIMIFVGAGFLFAAWRKKSH